MQSENVLMVKGYSTVRVKGNCRVLGMDVSNSIIKVRTGRVLPFEPAAGCELDAQGGEVWNAAPSGAGTAIWASIAEQILLMSGKRLRVMIVGATDTGKSTLSIYLANMSIESGAVPCIIDGDIGQGDLAPPGAIGAALIKEQATDLRDVDAMYYEFVGSVTPAGSERLVVAKMKSILGRTRRISRLQIINTDGYVEDGGIDYKRMLARALSPTVIVCLDQTDGLDSALGRGPWVLLKAKSSRQAVKTRSERIERRMDQFMHHVGGNLASVDLSRTRFIYRGRFTSLSRANRIFAPASIEGMFVGLGMRGIVKGFGIIHSLDNDDDDDDNNMQIRTSVQAFDTVYLGNIALKDGAEVRLY